MATGARSDRGLIRTGTDKAQSSASFELPSHHAAWRVLDDQDIDFDPNEDLTLRRTLNRDGRSRAYVNDQAVSVKLLAQIGGILLEVHGQQDGRGLLDSTTHITLLDQFGGHDATLKAVKAAYLDLQNSQNALDELLALQSKAGDDRDFLTHAIAELDRLDPRQGCLLYTSPSPRDRTRSRMPSSA